MTLQYGSDYKYERATQQVALPSASAWAPDKEKMTQNFSDNYT